MLVAMSGQPFLKMCIILEIETVIDAASDPMPALFFAQRP
jgi:hypothetical protein